MSFFKGFPKIIKKLRTKPADNLESNQIMELIKSESSSGHLTDILDSIEKNLSEPHFFLTFNNIHTAKNFIKNITFYPKKGMIAFVVAGKDQHTAIVAGKLSEKEFLFVWELYEKSRQSRTLVNAIIKN